MMMVILINFSTKQVFDLRFGLGSGTCGFFVVGGRSPVTKHVICMLCPLYTDKVKTNQPRFIERVLHWLKSWLKSAWNKHDFFNVTGSTVPIFVIEIVIEVFRTSSARSENFWLKSTNKS